VEGQNNVPENIREFNTIVGAIFAELYPALPIWKTLAMSHVLAVFGSSDGIALERRRKVFIHTVPWLIDEGYLRLGSASTAEAPRLCLAEKGLRAMNAVPAGLDRSVGSELVETAKDDVGGGRKIADIVGSFIGSATGSFAKSIGSG
jgi:hypothetical protein